MNIKLKWNKASYDIAVNSEEGARGFKQNIYQLTGNYILKISY